MKVEIYTKDEVPEKGVAIIASVNVGGSIQTAVGHYAPIEHKSASGDVVDTDDFFSCDVGHLTLPWDSVEKWSVLAECLPEYDFKHEPHPLYRRNVIAHTCSQWLTRKAREDAERALKK